MLASYIVNELTSQLPGSIVASFFFKDGQEKRTESHHAISGLLHQLFRRKPALAPCAREEFGAKGSSFTLSPEVLWNIMRTASARANTQIICIVDALDECAKRSRSRFIRALLSTFASTVSDGSTGQLKVLVTSRPWPKLRPNSEPIARSDFGEKTKSAPSLAMSEWSFNIGSNN